MFFLFFTFQFSHQSSNGGPFCHLKRRSQPYRKTHLFPNYNNSQKKAVMRRHQNQLQRASKENRYDQFTNLGIDLETSLNKSIILPKIYNKIAEIQASEYVRQRRMREDRDMYLLKDEIDRLRKKIYHIDEKKAIHRLKTQDVDTTFPENQSIQRFKQSFHMGSNDAIRNSLEMAPISRYQRNTDKDSIRRQDSNSIFMDKSQVKLTSSILQVQPKPLKMDPPKVKDQRMSIDNSVGLKIKTKSNNKVNGRLKRKFKIAAFAVYFSLFLPAYAKRHYQNRLKLMIQEYPHEIEKYYKSRAEVANSKFKIDEAKLWNYFDQKLNILDAIYKGNLANFLTNGHQVKMIKDHFQYLINNQVNSSDKQFKEHNTIQQQILFPRNTEYLLQGFHTIWTKFIDTFTSFITKSDFFSQKWKTFSLGILNNSFVHNSHPKLPAKVIESGIVRLHPFKEVLLVYDQQTECLLLGYDVMCRIFAYKWMSRLEKLKSQSQYSDEVRTVAQFMVTLFYLACQNALNLHIKNFLKENGECQASVKSRNKNIRPIIPLLVKAGRRRDEQLLKTTKLISNPPLQKEALQVIEGNPTFVLSLQEKIKVVGYVLFQKLKSKVKEENSLIKNQTLSENVFNNSQVKKNQGNIIKVKQNEDEINKSTVSIQKRLKIKQKI